MLNDIEKIIFNDEKSYIQTLKQNEKLNKNETNKIQTQLINEIALKDQIIYNLISEKSNLETTLFKSVKDNEILMLKLENYMNSEAILQQEIIELRLRGLDYKSEVDRRVERVTNSINGRLGYIPNGINKELSYLRILRVNSFIHFVIH